MFDQEYMELARAGFTTEELAGHYRQELTQAGFADQEVNAWIVQQQGYLDRFNSAKATAGLPAYGAVQKEPGFIDAAKKGFSHSTTGLRMQLGGSEAFTDQISDAESSGLPWHKGLVRDMAAVAGDLPDMAVGLMAGAGAGMLAGPAAPVAVPLAGAAGAFGNAAGVRRVLIDQLEKGNITGFEDLALRLAGTVQETTKGMAIGAATYAGGGAGANFATKMGAGVLGKAAGHFGGEMAGLMGSTGVIELRVPEASEWTSAAALILGMRALGPVGRLAKNGADAGVQTFNRAYQDVVPKLREIYAKTGKTPQEVVHAAKGDPSVVADLLSKDVELPGAFAEETLGRLKAGEEVPTEIVEAYKSTNWAQGVLNERSGPEVVKNKIANLYAQASEPGAAIGAETWAFVRKEEAKALSEATGLDIVEGYTHKVDAAAIRHTLKNHGNPAKEAARGQIAVTEGDFLHIPDIVRSPDSKPQYLGKSDGGLDVIGYEKRIDSETVLVVEEVRVKRNQLAFLSMRKHKASAEHGADPPTPTSKTSRDMTPSGNAGLTQSAEALNKDSITAPNVKGKTRGESTHHAAMLEPRLPEGVRGKTINQGEPVSLSAIIGRLGEALDVPIRTGSLGPLAKEVRGIYKERVEVIRTRVANEIGTVVHELGHHMDKMLSGEIDGKLWQAFAHELDPIATKANAGQAKVTEGFAEFVRLFVTDPEQAARVAPEFLQHFESEVAAKAPEAFAALKTAQEQVKAYLEQPAVSEVLSHISFDNKEPGFFSRLIDPELRKESWLNLKERVVTNFVDRLHPLKKVVEQLAEGRELAADENPYVLARLYAGAAGKANAFLEHTPFSHTTLEPVAGVKPLRGILEGVQNEGGSLQDFSAYLVAKRSVELSERGIRSGLREKTAREVVAQFEPKYGRFARELSSYQDALVNYLVEAGVLDGEGVAAMRTANQHYVPFQRVLDSVEGGGSSGGKGFVAKSPIKRIKGSGRDVINPLESIIANTYTMIDMAEKNTVGRALVDLAKNSEGMGWLIEEIPRPMQAVEVGMKEMLRKVKELDPGAYQTISSLASKEADVLTLFKASSFIDKKSQITVLDGGKVRVFQVAPELAQVMHDLSPEPVHALVKLLALPAKTLRAGAVLSPDFLIRNIIRDNLESAVKSESGFVPFVDGVRGLTQAIRRDDLYWNWVKSGGDQATLVAMDRTTLVRTLKDMEQAGIGEKVWNAVTEPLETLRLLSQLSEEATRLGEYGKAMEALESEGVSGKQAKSTAALRSRDVSIDFARRGAMMRVVNQLVPFTNAQVQSAWRLGESFKQAPGRTALKAALYITLPSVALAILTHDDEAVQQLPDWQRDMYWCFRVPGTDEIARIPKPFEVGVLLGSSPERLTRMAMDIATEKHGGDKTKAVEEALRGLGSSLFDVAVPRATPTFAMPFVQRFANKSLMTGRPIIPADREGMLPEYQYTPYTTEAMKALSQLVGSMPGVGQMNTFSPAFAEQLIRDWSGGLGMYALEIADAGLRGAGVLPSPVRPTPTLSDLPFVRAFVARNPTMGAQSITVFDDNMREADTYLRTIAGLKKEYNFKDIEPYVPYQAYEALDGPRKALQSIRTLQRTIWQSPSGTPDEKRQMLETLTWQAIQIAKEGNKAFDMVKGDLKRMATDRQKRTRIDFFAQDSSQGGE